MLLGVQQGVAEHGGAGDLVAAASVQQCGDHQRVVVDEGGLVAVRAELGARAEEAAGVAPGQPQRRPGAVPVHAAGEEGGGPSERGRRRPAGVRVAGGREGVGVPHQIGVLRGHLLVVGAVVADRPVVEAAGSALDHGAPGLVGVARAQGGRRCVGLRLGVAGKALGHGRVHGALELGCGDTRGGAAGGDREPVAVGLGGLAEHGHRAEAQAALLLGHGDVPEARRGHRGEEAPQLVVAGARVPAGGGCQIADGQCGVGLHQRVAGRGGGGVVAGDHRADQARPGEVGHHHPGACHVLREQVLQGELVDAPEAEGAARHRVGVGEERRAAQVVDVDLVLRAVVRRDEVVPHLRPLVGDVVETAHRPVVLVVRAGRAVDQLREAEFAALGEPEQHHLAADLAHRRRGRARVALGRGGVEEVLVGRVVPVLPEDPHDVRRCGGRRVVRAGEERTAALALEVHQDGLRRVGGDERLQHRQDVVEVGLLVDRSVVDREPAVDDVHPDVDRPHTGLELAGQGGPTVTERLLGHDAVAAVDGQRVVRARNREARQRPAVRHPPHPVRTRGVGDALVVAGCRGGGLAGGHDHRHRRHEQQYG